MTESMKAGPELDKLVAEKVMGWVLTQDGPGEGAWEDDYSADYGRWMPSDSPGAGPHAWETVPSYSTNIAAAWEVVEKVSELSDGHFTLMKFTTHYRAGFQTPVPYDSDDRFEHWSVADTAPLAICRAALAAVEKK